MKAQLNLAPLPPLPVCKGDKVEWPIMKDSVQKIRMLIQPRPQKEGASLSVMYHLFLSFFPLATCRLVLTQFLANYLPGSMENIRKLCTKMAYFNFMFLRFLSLNYFINVAFLSIKATLSFNYPRSRLRSTSWNHKWSHNVTLCAPKPSDTFA